MIHKVEHFEIVVFGGGKAGKTLAMEQARAGKSVAVVEAGMIGGSCINIACIPSKALIRSAQVAEEAPDTARLGTYSRDVETVLAKVRDRTAAVVSEMVATNQAAFDASGFTLVLGWGRFIGPRRIEVETESGKRVLEGDKVFINLGTKAAIPDVPGLRDAEPMTHVEALKLGDLPEHLLVVGGGYIGMELGQAFRRIGSKVTIIERGPRLASREDADVSEAIGEVLKANGVDIALNARIASVLGRSGDGVSITLADGRIVEGSHILVAAGRTPRTEGIGLELADVKTDDHGFIVVDERLRTTAEDSWALGEVAGTPMFTHASLDDYRIASAQLRGQDATTAGRTIPYCVFIDPEFASVGYNETTATQAGKSFRLARLPMDVVPRARTLSRRKGFMKALVSADDDQILGFQMLGENAGEVMTVVQTAMMGGLPYMALRDGIFAHPTISEGLNMLFAGVR